MDKQWLETFLCVSQTQNVSKAADILFLTQPTVSSRIQSLEQEVGEPMFLRIGKKMVLNEVGKAFHPFAIKILNDWNESREAIYEVKHKVRGTLNVVLFYALIPLLTKQFIAFNKTYPQVKLQIRTMHTDDIPGMVQSNMAQVGIVRQIDNPIFQAEPILPADFLLVVYPDHPFARQGSYTLEELLKESLIYLNSALTYKEMVTKYLGSKVLGLNTVMETDNVDICKQFILERMGIAIMPRFAVWHELEAKTLYGLEIAAAAAFNKSVDLIWLKDQPSFLVSTFVDYMKRQMNTLP